MRKLSTLFIAFLGLHFSLNAQVFWTENFDNTACSAGCGLPYGGINGNWTQVATGPAGDSPNLFYTSCAENGEPAGSCGVGCGSDNSLHVGSIILGDIGAAFFNGDGGLGFADATTSIRAESPTINCTGHSSITLAFNYIEGGDLAIDNAQLWYFNGTSWAMLNDLPKTPLCTSGQGEWTAFSITLPASADGNPNVRIGFSWVNDNDAAGTDPSFAVDDITFSTPSAALPTAGFTFSPAAPCTGQLVTFTNTSTGTGTLTYAWTFAGGTPATSALANPTSTFATAGPHVVTLIVTDSGGSDTITQTINVVSCTGPSANFSYSPNPICAGQVVTFTNTSSGGPFTAANWVFVGGTPVSSTSLGTATTTFPTPGNYTVVLVVYTASSSDTIVDTLTVVNCATAPVASFNISTNPICITDCINFTNTSTGTGPFTYAWTFTGASTPTSTVANPTGICYPTVGSFPVTLIVTTAGGADTVTQTVVVNNCVSAPVANFNAPDTICRGQCLNFTDLSTGSPTSWTWTFMGGTPSTSTFQSPINICFNTMGSFLVTLTATNAAGSDSYTRTIVVVNCSPPVTQFTITDQRICEGDCIGINNTTLNGESYAWSMPGATPDTSNAAEPGTVCYDSAGIYTITLIAFNDYGSDTFVQNIQVDTIPIIEAFPDVVAVSLGNGVELSVVANGPVDYAWVTTDTASIDDTTLAVLTVTPTAPGQVVYYVIATDGNGCSNTDSVFVDVYLTDVIGVPNAFSPNGDGYNDFLRVLGPGIETMRLIVYNRYGQLVFESTDQMKGWDGQHNGRDADPGVFAWYLEYTLVNGLYGIQKGNVTLIR